MLHNWLTPPKEFHRTMDPCILAMIDFSDATDSVVETSKSLAKALDLEIIFLHVGQPNPDFVGYEAGPETVRNSVAHELADEHHTVERIAESVTADGIRCRPMMVQGPTVSVALEQAEKHSARWIVVGSHGHGALFNLLMGSVSEGILRAAQCPVVVVPRPQE